MKGGGEKRKHIQQKNNNSALNSSLDGLSSI